MHWKCCWRPLAGHVLWIAAFIALIMAWVSIQRNNSLQAKAQAGQQVNPKDALVFGLEPLAWYWNALVLGVLAIGKKVSSSSCGCGSCEGEEGTE